LLTLAGFFVALYHLNRFRPDAVLIKGGFLGVPVGLAASLLDIPVFLHESDSIMGQANRFLARFAQKIFVAFPPIAYHSLPSAIRRKLIYTGLPIGGAFRKATSLRHYAATPTILITGGSQGARQINNLIAELLLQILPRYKVIHLSGALDYPSLRKAREKLPLSLKKNYELHAFRPFLRFIHSADLVISRAGATTLFELAAAGKPAIVIPLPGSANNHQLRNAKIFAARRAIGLLGRPVSAQKLLAKIDDLFAHPAQRKSLSNNIRRLDNPQAVKKMIRELGTE